MNLLYCNKSKGNCFILTKTGGLFTFKSFRAIQFVIKKNTKLYKKVWFKKIPKSTCPIILKPLIIILEFLIISSICHIRYLIKYITYKVPFKFKIIYIKINNENNNRY